MQADSRFLSLPKHFWANVRSISENLGYTDRKTKQIKVYTTDQMVKAMTQLNLSHDHLWKDNTPTQLGLQLGNYFQYRAQVLNFYVEPRLMDLDQAAHHFYKLQESLKPSITPPMNKQSGEKKSPAFLTAIVNMIIEAHAEQIPFDHSPMRLTHVTHANQPLRTFSRRMDGCFPSCTNPIAVWEIKEYYHTTTFGSRVADGIYETLLDGIEIEEAQQNNKIHIQHLLIIDSHRTWWEMGRSYLCRLIDILHMGYVDEILFGQEVIEKLPDIVKIWVSLLRNRTDS